MILAIDVDYREDSALAAGVLFRNWTDEKPESVVYSTINKVADYQPGQFYKREMPCILQLINDHNLSPTVIVIDGFVSLGHDAKPGLGMHLYQALDKKIPIVGVAKKAFKDSKAESEVYRGKSEKPLYVTAIGIEESQAIELVASMHGKHRFPTLLKQVDRECRQGPKKS
ncbi:endonuclease V [Vibrio sonorensis]|uniref:endonuclease V n=1 Tax=Vibrio sonorensis TaxID=1004316 RepID=UPI0008DB304B|nr:endonuclease V [Vibrio sonorensis]